jgi:endonuclease/exonuclease/phosphatase (EEP) superfamily protein YafD
MLRAGAGAVLVATALPLLRSDAWWVRVLDFPRAHIAFAGALVLAAGSRAARGRRTDALLFSGLTLAVGYQLSRIWPYTRLGAVEVVTASPDTAASDCSIIAANVLTPNRRAEGLLDSVRAHRPDLILILEADAWWERRLRELEADYPHAVRRPQSNTYGMLLYSRLPLLSPRVEFLVQRDVPSIHAQVRLASGALCELHMLHPHPPSPLGRDTTTGRDAELLIVGERVRDATTPALVAGDLNDVAWSRTTTLFQRISRLLDPRKGRGMYNTYNARLPLFRFPVDHVFHSQHFTLVELTRLQAFGSDHFPIYVSLRLQPALSAQQSAPADTMSARTHAQRKIAHALERPT